MKNIVFPSEMDPVVIHNKILKNKRNGKYCHKNKIATINDQLITAINEYEEKIQSNKLEELKTSNIFSDIQESLKTLYSYSCKELQEYKNKVIKSSLCPYCSLENHHTLDHYLPQSLFPQYSDEIHNLIPCCNACNEAKGNKYLLSGKRQIINLFIDILPKEIKFLKIEIDIQFKQLPTIKYSITDENKHLIGANLFDIISSTFTELHLPDRYRDEIENRITDKVISDIQISTTTNIQTIKNELIKDAKSAFNLSGINNWEGLFYEAAANNDEYLKFLIEQSKLIKYE